MTSSEHARETLRQSIGKLEEQIVVTLKDTSEDPVHDLRVSIRRVSQALRTFGPLLPGKSARSMRKALKPALDAAAIARDHDVCEALLVKCGLPEGHPLLVSMKAERDSAALALLGQVYLLLSTGAPGVWHQRVAAIAGPADDAALQAREALPPLASEFFDAGRKAAVQAGSAKKLHAFRLSAKRFRYTLELFRPFYGPVFLQRLERVRQIQSLLGKRQDCAVAADRLSALSATDPLVLPALAEVEARAQKS
ncbi:CHAD domain-containing protein [Paludibaculum fermentans]|uniref:CHAD domain-containing protein n=1 Tax=Paludibaculum fermentans TaxID=1473598 RepID=A0A7S7SI55_PALFE|nr:CHAD domain-containing protein [Paludibaculum fermentans]QOY85358.1 CHAD domain-containing protein [Paludibaculum fermentans]